MSKITKGRLIFMSKALKPPHTIQLSSVTTQTASTTQQQTKTSNGTHIDNWARYRRAELMANSSDSERAVYRILCNMGYKVIRQHPINTGRKQYFADLYLPELRTIIEIDGGYHYTKKQKRLDTNRSNGLWRLGYHILRLSNHDARDVKKIKAKIIFLTHK